MEKGRKKILAGIWSVLAALCIIYGCMVYAVGSGTAFFIVWLGLGVVFVTFAAAVWGNWWNRLSKWFRRLFVTCAGIGVLCFLIIEGFVLSGFAEHGEPNLDYIIVLGAQVYENGPSVVLKFRLEEAIAYLEENPDTKCILSGGQGYNEPFAEAVGMADYLMKRGIPEERLLLEKESATTAQNISNSRKMIEQDASVGIVTNNFHVFRAVRIAEKQGMEKVCGIAADTTKLYLPNNMLREFFAVMKFLLFNPDIR